MHNEQIQEVMAEEVGFEPTKPFGLLVFKTSAFSQTRPLFQTLVRVAGLEPATYSTQNYRATRLRYTRIKVVTPYS